MFLRGWGEYQPYGLKLTDRAPGPRSRRDPRLEPVGAPAARGRDRGHRAGDGWSEGDHGHGPAYQFRDPDGHRLEIFDEQDRYVPPERLRPRLKNVPQRHVDRGAAVKRIDHVNILAADVAANRRFAEWQLGVPRV